MELKLNDIIIDENLNVRESLDDETVERYMGCFDQLPAVVAFNTDDGYLLADGFHRVEAAKRLEREEIEVNVMQGTRQAAEEHAAIANLKHGKPLTRAERGKAVEVMLKLHTERSDSWIADDMGVSKNTVAKYREELESNCQIDSCSSFITKDGRKYPREIKQPKKDEQTSDEQVDEQSRETMQEVPDEQPKVAEAEVTSEEIEQVADAEPQAEQPEPDAVEAQTDEPQFYCDEQFCSLDDIKEYIGTPVEVVISAGRRAANVAKHGVILDVVEQEGKFVLDFENENGEKQQIPTGTTTGEATDIGILEIRIVEKMERTGETSVSPCVSKASEATPKAEQVQEIEAAEIEVEAEAEVRSDGSQIEMQDFSVNWARLLEIYEKFVEYKLQDIAHALLKTEYGVREVNKLKGFFAALAGMMEKTSDDTWWER